MKRFTCMILVLLIGLSTSICFADDVTNNSFVKDAVQTMLTNASYNPSVYDMENVYFQNLKIGNKINYYKVVDFDEVSLQTNIHKYPIYDDEVVIGIPPENRGALQISKASPRAKQKHLLVPGVKQAFNGVCWAACVSSMGSV